MEKYRERERNCIMYLLIQEVCNRVPRRVTWWVMRLFVVVKLLLLATVIAVHDEVCTVISTIDGDGEGFQVELGLHQVLC